MGLGQAGTPRLGAQAMNTATHLSLILPSLAGGIPPSMTKTGVQP